MPKINQLITLDQRISMLQTCYNNAGRNYQGKRVKAATITGFADKLFLEMIEQVKATERNAVRVQKEKPKKRVPKKKAERLLKKAARTKK